MQRYAITPLLLLLVLGFSVTPAATQSRSTQPPPPAPSVTPAASSPDARATREQLRQILRQVPPSVGEILRRDPLLATPTYLAAYPSLVAFLQQHPEIARNPSFFLGSYDYYESQPRDRSFDMFQMVIAGLGMVMFGLAVVGLIVWLVRSTIEQRRWQKMAKTQADAHTKVLDRLTNSDELLAYVQSSAGRKFLESAPIAVAEGSGQVSAPVSRIIWSLQAGVVLACLGIGFWIIQYRTGDISEGFSIIGTVILALGLGFVVSALFAYVISSRFGLIAPRRSPEP